MRTGRSSPALVPPTRGFGTASRLGSISDPHVLVRAEFRDYLMTFPRQQIVPAPHNKARGVFEQFTPLFGLSYTF